MLRPIAVFILLVFSLGCGSPHSQDQNNPSSPESPDPGDNEELSPISPRVTYASGWNEMIITANSAKTTVSTGAHFSTTRNACWRDAYGAINLETWNTLAKNANMAAQKEPVAADYCVPIPDTYPYMDGTVEMKTGQKLRKLYIFKEGEICSTIADPVVSDALLNTIHYIVGVADKEDADCRIIYPAFD